MSKEFKIEKVINPDHVDDCGRPCKRIRQIKLYYHKGRGIVLSITTLDRSDNSDSSMLFSEGNTSVTVERLSRPKPTMLSAFAAALEAETDRIMAGMDGYDDDEKWSDERRKEYVTGTLVPIVRGQPVAA